MRFDRTILLVLCASFASLGAAAPQPDQPDAGLRPLSENLVANGDFRAKDPEQRPLRWVVVGEEKAAVQLKEHHGRGKDDSALKITDTSAARGVLVRSEKRIAAPKATYRATAWAKAGSGQPAHYQIEFWDQNNVRLAVQPVAGTLSGSWTELSGSAVAPDRVTHVTVSIESTAADQGTSYWDDVSLQEEIVYDPHVTAGVHELFMDDYRVESLVDVERHVHPGRKTAPLIVPDRPWEGNSVYIYGSVFHDEPPGTGFRMWYSSYNEDYHLCFATSEDGLTWTKPLLGFTPFRGSAQNNIVNRLGGTILFDPVDSNPDRRYKLMSYRGEPKAKSGYFVAFSPDGFHWTEYDKNPVITYGDVSNVAYDRAKHLFIATTKQRMLISNTSVTPGKMDRAAFVSVSQDFVHWSAPGAPDSPWVMAVEGDPSDDMRVMSKGGLEAQIYGMPVYPYEGIYIGLPWVFDVMNYDTGIYATAGEGPIQPEIAVSRDLRHWSRPARAPVIPLGTAGSWDDGTIYTASNWIVSDTSIDLYYGGMNLGHGGDTPTQRQTARIAKASWRRDGLVSLRNGGDDPGVVITRPLAFAAGSKLRVNAQLAEGGSLEIAIVDASGNAIPGYGPADSVPLTGDSLAFAVAWKNGRALPDAPDKALRLRFRLIKGDLYSYWFE